MNAMSRRLLSFGAMSLMLFSCSIGNSVPKKGYKLFKEQYASYGIRYNSCNYVYITGDGTLSAGSLVGTVWYKVNYTIGPSGDSRTANTYVYYKDGFSSAIELDSSTSYYYAKDLVSDGALKGKMGSL